MFKKLLLMLSLVPAIGACFTANATRPYGFEALMNVFVNVGKKDEGKIDYYCVKLTSIYFDILNKLLQNIGVCATQAEQKKMEDILKQFVITGMSLFCIEAHERVHNKSLSSEGMGKLGFLRPLFEDLQKSNLMSEFVFKLLEVRHVSREEARLRLAYFDNFFVQMRKSFATIMSSKKAFDLFKRIELSSEVVNGLPKLYDQFLAIFADGFHIIMEKILNGKLKLDGKSGDNFMQKIKATEPELKSKIDALILEMNAQA